MAYTTVRISEQTHGALRRIAQDEGKPMHAVVEEAVESLRRRRFLEQVNAAYAELRSDPRAWESVARERKEWDGTLLDGLGAAESRTRHQTRTRRAARRTKR